MTNMVRGYRSKLEDHIDINRPFRVEIDTQGNAVYDSCCFGVDQNDRLSDDRYMVFYNQTASPQQEIRYEGRGNAANYTVSLKSLPQNIVKLVFTVSIDGNGIMNSIRSHTVRIVQDDNIALQLELHGIDFRSEKAIISVEIYMKSVWRICATASGFNGGLGDLLESFGGEIAEPQHPTAPNPAPAPKPEPAPAPVPQFTAPKPEPAPAPVPQFTAPKPEPAPAPVPQFTAPKPEPAPAPVPQFTAPKPEPAPAPVPQFTAPKPESAPAPVPQFTAPKPEPAPAPVPQFTAPKPVRSAPAEMPVRVELRKGEKINLAKKGISLGEIVINLNWNQPAYGSIDLDLECLYELSNGKKFGVQALGGNFGSFNAPPFIKLDGDDRSGSNEEGENLRINGAHISEIRRILVFTSIYEGAANWEQARGVVTVKCPGNPELVVRLDSFHPRHKICAIALLENQNNQGFSVEKLVDYFESKPKMDQAYNWGLRWKAGTK